MTELQFVLFVVLGFFILAHAISEQCNRILTFIVLWMMWRQLQTPGLPTSGVIDCTHMTAKDRTPALHPYQEGR